MTTLTKVKPMVHSLLKPMVHPLRSKTFSQSLNPRRPIPLRNHRSRIMRDVASLRISSISSSLSLSFFSIGATTPASSNVRSNLAVG